MKKINYLVLLVFIIISSCNKSEDTFITKNDKVNEIAVSQVINNNNEDLQRNLYRSLTTSEKAAVWKNKYRKLLLISNLTMSQRSYIEKLEKLVTPDLFIKNKENANEKLNIQALKETAISLFGVSGAYYLIASITKINMQKKQSAHQV